MSVARAMHRPMTSCEGSAPLGKIIVRMKLRDTRSIRYARSSIVIACSSIAPSGSSRSEHLAKKVSKSFQPTASIISTETSLS